MSTVLLFGEPQVTLTAPKPRKRKNSTAYTWTVSGPEVNVAIGLCRLGHSVRFLSRLGEDPFGHCIFNMFQANGIDTSAITWDPRYSTGIRLKRPDEQKSTLSSSLQKTAASHISLEDIDALDLSDIDLIHLTGSVLTSSLQTRQAAFHLLDLARDQQIPISFDPDLHPDRWEDEETMKAVVHEIVARTDIFLPDLEECEQLCGLQSLEEIFDFYESLGAKTTVIKDGSNGASYRTDGEILRIPGFPVDQIVDSTGAGDGFAAGLLSGILEELPLFESIRRGNALGAFQVTSPSDNDDLPKRADLISYIDRIWIEPEEII